MTRPPREPMQPPSPFRQLVVTLTARKWFLLAVALLGGILAGLAGFARPVLFEATTQIIIDAPSTGTSNATATTQDSLDSSIDDHLTMLSSQAHLRRVLTALRQPQASNVAGKSGISAVPPTAGSFVSDLLSRIWSRGKPAAGSPEAADAADAAALKTLRNGMRVGQELRSRVISIGFTDASPARAALVANTFAQVYIEDLVQKRRASDQFELDSLVASLPQVQKDLVEATDRLETYRLTHGAVDHLFFLTFEANAICSESVSERITPTGVLFWNLIIVFWRLLRNSARSAPGYPFSCIWSQQARPTFRKALAATTQAAAKTHSR